MVHRGSVFPVLPGSSDIFAVRPAARFRLFGMTSSAMTTNWIESTATLAPIELGTLPPEPLVSVLVSNYNYADYLPETIDSVLAQNYRNWELVICDDGSTDSSITVISAYVAREARIRLLRKQNGGHASGLNAAFAACRGEIICLLDSDDLFTPDKLLRVVECCQRQPDRGLIVHRVVRVTADRQKQGVWPLTGALPDGWYGPGLLKGGGMVPYMPPTSGLAVRRRVAERLFPLPTTPPVHICPDQVLMRLAPLVTPIAAIKETLAEQRLHQNNTYGMPRMTAATISREMMLGEALWEQQRLLLRSIDEGLANRFEPVLGSQHMLFLGYTRAKLTRDPDVRLRHEEYMRVLEADVAGRNVWLWRMSIYFPIGLFDRILNFLYGQSRLKQLVARFRGAA